MLSPCLAATRSLLGEEVSERMGRACGLRRNPRQIAAQRRIKSFEVNRRGTKRSHSIVFLPYSVTRENKAFQLIAMAARPVRGPSAPFAVSAEGARLSRNPNTRFDSFVRARRLTRTEASRGTCVKCG